MSLLESVVKIPQGNFQPFWNNSLSQSTYRFGLQKFASSINRNSQIEHSWLKFYTGFVRRSFGIRISRLGNFPKNGHHNFYLTKNHIQAPVNNKNQTHPSTCFSWIQLQLNGQHRYFPFAINHASPPVTIATTHVRPKTCREFFFLIHSPNAITLRLWNLKL